MQAQVLSVFDLEKQVLDGDHVGWLLSRDGLVRPQVDWFG